MPDNADKELNDLLGSLLEPLQTEKVPVKNELVIETNIAEGKTEEVSEEVKMSVKKYIEDGNIVPISIAEPAEAQPKADPQPEPPAKPKSQSLTDLFGGGKKTSAVTPPTTPITPTLTAPLIVPGTIATPATEFIASMKSHTYEPIAMKRVENLPQKREDFDLSPDKGFDHRVITVYGLKGSGKTMLEMSIVKLCEGNVYFLSFDNQTKLIKKQFYKDEPRVTVFDGIRYLDKSAPKIYLASSEASYNYVNVIIESWRDNPPDWVIIDGADILQSICEMTMRIRNKLSYKDGIANRNIWKERKMYVEHIHNNVLRSAKRGIMYGTYTKAQEVMKNGNVVESKTIPHWIGIVMHQTNTIIKTTSELTKANEQRFYAHIESSKLECLPTGGRIDITNKGFEDLLKGESCL